MMNELQVYLLLSLTPHTIPVSFVLLDQKPNFCARSLLITFLRGGSLSFSQCFSSSLAAADLGTAVLPEDVLRACHSGLPAATFDLLVPLSPSQKAAHNDRPPCH